MVEQQVRHRAKEGGEGRWEGVHWVVGLREGELLVGEGPVRCKDRSTQVRAVVCLGAWFYGVASLCLAMSTASTAARG